MSKLMCYKCRKEKTVDEFPFDKRRNKMGRPCNQCNLERGRKYHALHRKEEKDYRDKNKANIKQWFLDNPERVTEYRSQYNRMYRISKEYGLSPQEYEEINKNQGGLCAICGQPETQMYNSEVRVGHLCIDHDHVTNKIRGLLCMRCNRAIGLFLDNAQLLKKASEYLEEYG